MTGQILEKEDIATITQLLLNANRLIEDAACVSRADRALQDRLREIKGNVSEELLFLEMMAPRVVRPAAWRTG